ncbi:Solute carrier family 28 member 3 [Pleurostoma richardsiae]|uniref:Solute carrier family 28 member 3 n=1 Tax=Pleurostoma richardsiae TaxID=41990 RepID=A0AA38RXN9_9PEZI|nr:Solute carrier family 28 member 3 [Pleurostoma richardsiae]
MSSEDEKITPSSAAQGHNSSLQAGVERNPDPALDVANEHHHPHVHHGKTATPDAEHEVVYAKGAEPVPDLPDYDSNDKEGQATELGHADSGSIGSIRRTKWTIRRIYADYKPIFHVAFWMVWTAWWIYGLVFHRHDHLGWLKPTLLYIGITLRIITLWVPAALVLRAGQLVWKHTALRVYSAIPAKLHQPLAAVVTVAVFLIGSMVPKETGQNTRANRAISLFGLVVMIALLYATSRDRRRIPWHTVIGGMLTQFIVAVFVLRTKAGYDIFNFISFLARTLLGFANEGVVFLTAQSVVDLHWFLTGVVPPIIFFVALVQLLYHIGLLQWFIGKFAVFFFWTLRVSGAEAVVAAATPFIGQGESAMLVRPFIPHLTMAEIHQVMTCGFATIAGSVLVSYVGLGLNPQALVSSCIMSIPASLAVSKMRYPETEETLTSGRVVVPDDTEHRSANALHAFANGAWLGIKIAGMIIATLLCIIAFVGLINGFLTWWGKYWGINEPYLTLQLILGYVLYPVAWLLGVPKQDLRNVGELIGIKIIINEYAAFSALTTDAKYAVMGERSRLIATYACCGFGNIGSLGTQIGVLTQLAPGRAGDVSKVALSALFSGVLATLTSASMAGMLFTEGMSGI